MYYCVLDFEATCIENKVLYNQEIIHFPSILYKLEDNQLELISTFNEYVKPTIDTRLSEFCTNLTGIQQETIDQANTFKSVFKKHWLWLDEHHALENLVFITVGDWDLSTMLPKQLKLLNMKQKKEYTRWINIKKEFKTFYGFKSSGLNSMLQFLGMEFIGRPHNGYDDTFNTARIFEKMVGDGHAFV